MSWLTARIKGLEDSDALYHTSQPILKGLSPVLVINHLVDIVTCLFQIATWNAMCNSVLGVGGCHVPSRRHFACLILLPKGSAVACNELIDRYGCIWAWD